MAVGGPMVQTGPKFATTQYAPAFQNSCADGYIAEFVSVRKREMHILYVL